jgi:hypothetical protein
MKRPVACGLYVLEALAMGVPVVEPAIGAFPELLEMTGGGVLCGPAGRPAEGRFDQTRLRRAAPDQTRLRRAEALAAAMKPLLLNPGTHASSESRAGANPPSAGCLKNSMSSKLLKKWCVYTRWLCSSFTEDNDA